jgi:hypothetical protein
MDLRCGPAPSLCRVVRYCRSQRWLVFDEAEKSLDFFDAVDALRDIRFLRMRFNSARIHSIQRLIRLTDLMLVRENRRGEPIPCTRSGESLTGALDFLHATKTLRMIRGRDSKRL